MSKKINLKGLGIKQLRLIKRMFDDDLVVRVICDDYGNKRTIELHDISGDNVYEDVPHNIMKSLGSRNVFEYFGWMPALSITIDTYSLKKEAIKMLGWNKPNSEPAAQVSDTTNDK